MKKDLENSLSEFLSSNKIDEGKVNQSNLARFRRADEIVRSLLEPIDALFEFRLPGLAESVFITEYVNFGGMDENKKLFKEFVKLIDYFSVAPIKLAKLSLLYQVYDIIDK